jgi:signal transduction histidine kinase/ligand-binding sensor domain-containing protein
MQRTTIFLASFFISVNSFAQVPQFTPAYNFKHLDVQKGLVQNIVYHFLNDSRGYMWIGTHNGITMYDGTRTINFLHDPQVRSSLAGNFINSMLEDSANNIWVGNENGMDRYERRTNSFTHFGVDRENGTKENTYCVLLGFITTTDLWFLDTKTKTVRSLNTKTGITSFISAFNATHAHLYKSNSDQTVHLWSAYDKGTVHQVYKGEKKIKDETLFDGKSKITNNTEFEIIHVLQQKDSTVWLSANKGLVKLDLSTNKYKVYDSWRDQIVRELRYTIAGDNGQLWVATGPDGIYTFDSKTNQFINNLRNDKFDPFTICSDNIVSLYLDKAKNLWCGSYGNGLSYTNTGSSFFTSHISKKETEAAKGNNHISLLGVNLQGNIWCSFENIHVISLLDKNYKFIQYRNPITEDGLPYTQSLYKLLFETNDEAWCATNRGLFIYNFKTNKMRSVPYKLISEELQGSIWIRDIIRLHDGSIVFSTFQGLYHLTKRSGIIEINPINFLEPGVFNAFIKLMQDDKGLLWVKSGSDFIYVLKPSANGNEFNLIKSIDFMPEVNQFFNQAGDSVLYIASDDGLYSVNKNTFELRKEKLDERIPFISISSFLKKDEKFWLFGEKGLYCFDKKNNESRTFTVEDGLPSDEFVLGAFAIDQNGRCVAGTSNGLVSFSLSDVKNITNSPRAQLTAVYINDILDTALSNPDDIKELKLSSRQNTFSFDFSSISFFHTNECSFEYMLEGYDDNWVKSGAAHYTRYSKIPPGTYTFHLRVLDNQGKVSPYNKSLQIEIAKSFWQTNLFRAALAAFLVFCGWLFLKWYSNENIKKQQREFEKLKAVEKERTRIATDMHDDLGAGLSRIKFLSETIGIKKQQHLPFEEDIIKIREYSHEMIDKMGEIVWALNEKNDSLSDLLSYIRVYAVGYLSQNGIGCKMEMPDNIQTTFVSGEFRRNIYLTIKEALHNVVKHAQASSVTITIRIDHKLEIILADNGIGFDKNNIRPFSNGLTNMESRIKEINGNFVVYNGNGTVVKIIAPLQV